MNKEDAKYLYTLKLSRKVYAEQGAVIAKIAKAIDRGDTLFGISTRVMFDKVPALAFNIGRIGLSSEKSIKAYREYLEVLMESIKEEFEENELKIKAIESKNDAEKIS